MRHLIIIGTTVAALTLFACSSKENNTGFETKSNEGQPMVTSLPDSLIPEYVRSVKIMLEKKGIKTMHIMNSKWRLFGVQGIWLQTEEGVVDILPIPEQIDKTQIEVLEIDSDVPDFHTYEIRYKGELQQSPQGHLTYFTVGKVLMYKTKSKTLNDELLKIEFN